jgi:hypothetical protein
MRHTGRAFQVEGSLSDWHLTAPSFFAGPFPNQQQAIDVALALAAREDGSVTWCDNYTGAHTTHPAPKGWFSDSLRVLRGAPPVEALLAGLQAAPASSAR